MSKSCIIHEEARAACPRHSQYKCNSCSGKSQGKGE